MQINIILGTVAGIATAAVIGGLLSISIPTAQAATEPKEIVYVDRVVERVIYVPVPTVEPTIEPAVDPATQSTPDPEAIFADTSEADRYCLAQNMYFESRGESQVGQEFVAWVTLNRVMDPKFPKDICSVVWQDQQFSWTHDGKSDTPTDPAAWAQAQAIAEETLLAYGVDRNLTEGATYFHAHHVNPPWAQKFERVVQIDGHIFYADRG
jgi:spore germination cell wall hydrolase CwlJ-like protein